MSHRARVVASFATVGVLAVPLYLAAFGGTPSFEPDSSGYLAMARDLADGRIDRLWPRTVGYPALLVLTGSTPAPSWLLLAVQLALHGVAVGAVAYILARLGVGRAALATFGLVAFSPPFVEHAAFVLSESLTQALLCIGVVAWLCACLEGGTATLATAAASLGLVGLSHPVYAPSGPIAVGVALGAWALLPLPQAFVRRTLVGGSVVVLATVGVVASVSAWNAAHFGFAGFSPLVGITLSHKTPRLLESLPPAYGPVRAILIQHRDADLVDPQGDHLGYAYIYRALPDLERATGLTGPALSSYLVRMNLALIARKPMAYLDEVGRSLLWWASPGVTAVGGLGSPIVRAAGHLERVLVNAAVAASALLLAGPVVQRILRTARPLRRTEAVAPGDARLFVAATFLALALASALTSSALTAAVWRLRVPVDLLLLAFACLAPTLWRDLACSPTRRTAAGLV